MRKYFFAFVIVIAQTVAGSGCQSDQSEKNNKSAGADSTLQDSSRLDSFGGDGTAKSRKGTTNDSTVMGTPPD